jgi:hypothetical protein
MWGDGDLPDEVAMAILSLLDYEDLLNVSLVNRRAHALCSDTSLWAALVNCERRWRAHSSPAAAASAASPANHTSVGGNRLAPRTIDERLAFYASLAANLDPSTHQLFLRT